jgi:hypothetical protein
MPKTTRGSAPARKPVTESQKQLRVVVRQEAKIARLERERDTMNGRLGSCLRDLSEMMKERDHALHDLEQRNAELDKARFYGVWVERQGRHLRALYEAMVQRYVGVKLDTQQFTFPQARQFLDNELESLRVALEGIREQADLEYSNSCAMAPVEREAA